MKRKILLLVMLILMINFLGGCWSKRELTEIAIASGIGIDKVEGGYLVTAQIVNPGEVAGERLTTRVEVNIYRTRGRTIFEALRRLTLEVPRRLYLGHMQVLIFGEELAKEGIKKSLDFFLRDHEIRPDFYILVARGNRATDVLEVLTPIERIPANKIHLSLEAAERSWAPVKAVNLDDAASSLSHEGKDGILTGVILKGDPKVGGSLENVEQVDEPMEVGIDNLAVFKDGKLVGWLDERESRSYNSIMGNVQSSVITMPCKEGGQIAIEILNTTSNIRGIVEKSIPKIEIDFELEGNVGEVNCDLDLTSPTTISEMEKNLEEVFKKRMEEVIKKAQRQYKSDIFGFGQAIHRTNPKVWKEIKKNWTQEFENLEVSIQCQAEIRREGKITNTFME